MKTLGKVIMIAITISGYLYLDSTVLSNKITKNKLPKKDRIDQAMSQEFLMTADPIIQKIPKRRVLKAQKYMRQLLPDVQTRSANLDWEERGPNNVGGRTRAILFDENDASGNTVFAAGVSGGLWKSSNINNSNPQWNSVDDFFGSLAICAIAQDPTEHSTIYFGTGEGFFEFESNPGIGLYRSLDGGHSWGYLNATADDQFSYIQDIKVDHLGNVYAATKSGLFKSSNKGNSWSRKLGTGKYAQSDHINKIVISDNGDLYATIGIFDTDGIYKSTNGGESWNKLSSGLPTSGYSRIELAQAKSNQNVLYALFADSEGSACLGVYRSVNGGDTWSTVSNPPAEGMDNFTRTQAWYNLAIEVSPDDENELVIGGIDILKSSNGGNSWSQLTSWLQNSSLPFMHPDQHILKYNPTNQNQLLVGNDGGIWISNNAQSTFPSFAKKNNGYNITQFYGVAAHPTQNSNYFLAGAQDNGTQKFNSHGMNSTVEVSGGDGVRCFIDQDNPQIQITSYVHNNYFVSIDGGQSFNYVPLNNFGFFANPNCYDSDKNILYASSSEGNILRWKNPENLISSFQHIIVSTMNGQKASYVIASPNNPNRLYIGTAEGDVLYIDGANNGIFKSGTKIREASSGYVSSIDIENGNEDHIIISYSNYGMVSIYETCNGGNSWNSIEENLPDVPVRYVMFNPTDPQSTLCATEIGIWSRTSGQNGGQWSPENQGMANVRVDHLLYRESDDLLIAATHGRGLFTTTLESNGVVPVDIISFDLSLDLDHEYITLDWIVGQEINIDQYVIEKSFDGSVWDDIGSLKGIDSYSHRQLSFEDRDLFIKDYNYYYRIRIEDRDGSITYSHIESIYLNGSKKGKSISFYPNPFTNGIFLDLDDPDQISSAISITDYRGTVVYTIPAANITQNHFVDLESYPDGVYVISYLNDRGKKIAQRVIKQTAGED